MTEHAAFKQQVRARMAKTGERYAAARRSILAGTDGTPHRRRWVSEPELADERVREATGRGWDEWCDLIDGWAGHTGGHTAVATHLREVHGVPGWWAQAVTGGWERITGRRLPNQMTDGTFTANRSRTVAIPVAELREALLDEEARLDLFPGLATELRSRPTSKAIRVRIGPGSALFDLAPKPDGRTTVSVSHERLPTVDDLEQWKSYWSDWLTALEP